MWLVLALTACTPETNVQQQYPEAAASPDVLDFGEVAVEYASELSFQLINGGRVELAVSNLAVDDTYGAYEVGAWPTTVAAGEQIDVPVTFHPPDFTTYTATITATTNDPDNGTLSVALTGTGVEVPTPDIAVDTLSLDFGTVGVGAVGTKWVVVTNEGEGVLEVSGITRAGSGSFLLVGDTAGFTVQPGQSTNIIVNYVPTTDIGDNGSITFTSNDPDEPEVTVMFVGNGGGDFEYPVAIIDGPTSATPRTTLTLDGSASFDPNNLEPLTYKWSIVSVPEGSQSQLSEPDNLDSVYLPTDLAGIYSAQLQVTNSIGLVGIPAIYVVDAIPQEQLHVEMSWNTGSADLDLHLLTSAGVIFGQPDDCNFCNQGPDWGASGDADDPSLDLDAQFGYGPENINIDAPMDDTYYVKVHYYEDNGDEDVVATVRIYTYGVMVGEYSNVLHRNEVWDVAEIRWPDGVAIEQSNALYLSPRRGCYAP